MLTLGIEEEYLLLDPDSGLPVPKSEQVRTLARRRSGLPADELMPELLQDQVEIATPVCRTLDDATRHLTRLRRAVGAAASAVGCRPAMTGTEPFPSPVPTPPTDEPHYRELAAETPRVIHEHSICGMHVHVAVPDRDQGVVALNRLRPWLPVLVALAANSPLWSGRDTGFASWRTLVYGRWPVSGPPPVFADGADYERRTQALLDARVIRGRGRLYWHARLSERHPTVEVRAMDVQVRIDEAVTLAGLTRGLVATALREDAGKAPPPHHLPHELLTAATWHAARDGLDGDLLDPRSLRGEPAADVVAALLDHVAAALGEAGDLDRVTTGVRRLLDEGNGAHRQRRALRTGGPALVGLLTGAAPDAGPAVDEPQMLL
ncbi:glutamate--cysteine ligase [Streptomyces sp. NPDC046727]|uniref:carboxylate-amine ligase n=1 Tax=Streptomyces sp. NPDC046727 TaxID=3155373 RepID=UPI003405EA94